MQRSVMISGGSRGIGAAIAERLLREGHRLSLGVRDPAALAAGLERQGRRPDGGQLQIHPYDARSRCGADDSAEAWVAATASAWGGIDAVVHSAGIVSRTPFLFPPGEEAAVQGLLEVNLMGPWRLSRAVWPHLVASGDGRVISLVSMSGKRIKGRLAAYGVSKFALMGLCQAMRNEGWEAGIRVTALCPGWVNTAMAAAVDTIPKAAMTQPEDLAATVAHLLTLPPAAVPFELAVNCVLESGC
ncbi:SDR family NAD(P)-dependent oxidoreductase [Cyanobium sp. NIES-981]|uniref:SDR family NAD(P)-dependent oxidoreductase n=1 Tax=Cyanobium sp. NIES-981 TaxID=1851505 RepID=UPI0007DDCEB1|nr:SDR family NAD(P)-dependent oxidoreductase [Cyanobium sp. NIES-981]SBO42759.1 Short-chain alcohol dehydrogenase [Cyanobium sp. NIES-981]